MYEKITLPNGVRIVYEHIPYVRSVSMGIWVGAGSRYEKPSENGVSHFIEHMLFKGTTNRTAADIARQSDSIGGQINAFTTTECICFYGRVLDEHLKNLTDILCDMFFNSKFSPEDIENERGVIFEEIDMYEDTPDDLVAERLISSVFKGSSLSRPVLGTKKTLSAMTSDTLKAYKSKHFDAESVVIALSGSFSQNDIDMISSRFSVLEKKGSNTFKKAVYTPAFVTKKKNIEQNHLCIGFEGIPTNSEDRFAFQLISGILGGGSSSRLFQSVREKNGLCYSIFSFNSSYASEGLFSIYTALSKETEAQALSLIKKELVRFKDEGVTEAELDCAKQQAKANILMGLESTSTRMNRLGRGELFSGHIMDIDEICERYESVTREQIRALAEKHFDFSRMSFSAVGKTATPNYYRAILEDVP